MTWTVKMADARYDGYEEGFDEGFTAGREAGLQQGLKQGIEQGLEQGAYKKGSGDSKKSSFHEFFPRASSSRHQPPAGCSTRFAVRDCPTLQKKSQSKQHCFSWDFAYSIRKLIS